MQIPNRRKAGFRRVTDLSRRGVIAAFVIMAAFNICALFSEHQLASHNDTTYNLLTSRIETHCVYDKNEHDAFNSWINELEQIDRDAAKPPITQRRAGYLHEREAAFDKLRNTRSHDLAAICGLGTQFK